MLKQRKRPAFVAVPQVDLKRRSLATAIHVPERYAIALSDNELEEVHADEGADLLGDRLCNV